ncbi:MAG: flagellar FlbD family protein [Lawsonibacter sp.]
MIVLTKMNKETFLVNHSQIECIECIPESKIVMMNHDSYLVRESAEEIVQKIIDYTAKVMDIHRQLTITDARRK